MMLAENLLVYVTLVCFLPLGHSLKCYASVCSTSSVGPSPSCASPQELTCAPLPGLPMTPDRCITQRLVMEMSGITVHQEIRNCSYSIQCNMRDTICNFANKTGYLKKCEIGCCQGDLCNSGGPIPTQAPRPTGPSGADLSCYSCSDSPIGGMSKMVSCKNPVKQTCSVSPFSGTVQDRCVTLDVQVKVPSLGTVRQKMKNCSDALFCNQDTTCKFVNNTGMISSCKVSCCYGNLCNSDAVPTTVPGASASATATPQSSTTVQSTSESPGPSATTVPVKSGSAAKTTFMLPLLASLSPLLRKLIM